MTFQFFLFAEDHVSLAICKDAHNKIHSFWTRDGSVLVKETERSRPLVVKSRQDIYRLGGEILNGDEED
jgi:hypothetical protein